MTTTIFRGESISSVIAFERLRAAAPKLFGAVLAALADEDQGVVHSSETHRLLEEAVQAAASER